MLEKDFQSRFMKWLVYSNIEGAFELKLCKKDRFQFCEVRTPQRLGLDLFAKDGLSYKIPDEGPSAKPFDCFKMKGKGYLVIMFYIRGENNFYVIPMPKIEKLIKDGKRSITQDEAAKIGEKYNLHQPIK